MKEKLSVLSRENLRQAVKTANEIGLERADVVGIVAMPNSAEFSIVYWEKYE